MKLKKLCEIKTDHKSHPVRVRGLKREIKYQQTKGLSVRVSHKVFPG